MGCLILCHGTLHSQTQKKLKIKSVDFERNEAFKKGDLHKIMLSRPSGFLKPSYYDHSQLQDDLRNLEIFYQRRGFLQAKMIDHQVEIDTSRHRVRIRIEISEGERTYVDTLRIRGNHAIPTNALLGYSKIRKDQPLSNVELDHTIDNILKQYAEKGYLEAQITTHIQIDTLANSASIDLVLEENARFKIDRIHLNGLEKTAENVVHRELQFRREEFVNSTRLLDSQRRLYRTGLFRSVFIRPQPAASGDSTKKDIGIDLKEDKAGEFHVALGYGTIEKLRTSVELSYGNLFGKALKSGIEGQYSSIEKKVEAFVTEPWIFGVPWSANVNGGVGLIKEPGYSLEIVGGEMSFGHEFFRRSSLNLAFEIGAGRIKDLSREFFKDTGFDTLSTEMQDFLLTSIKVKANLQIIKLILAFDRRNNLFNTSAGSYLEFNTGFNRTLLQIDLLGNSIRQSIKSLRFGAIFKYFHSVDPSTTFASAVELGGIKSLSGSPESIPASELFFTGGPNSLRGFEYQKVGPLDDDGKPLGGRLKFVWNVFEVRRRLYKFIDGLIFLDTGNVWESPADFDLSDIRSAAGLGLRIFIPIGILRFDYGINLAPRGNESKRQFYFGLGHAF